MLNISQNSYHHGSVQFDGEIPREILPVRNLRFHLMKTIDLLWKFFNFSKYKPFWHCISPNDRTKKNNILMPDKRIRKSHRIELSHGIRLMRDAISPMLVKSYAIWKPTSVWTVIFRSFLYPSLRIIIFVGSVTLYGLKNFWFTLSLSLISIRNNDWYDFRTIFAPDLIHNRKRFWLKEWKKSQWKNADYI